MKIYVAGPFFTQEERENLNQHIETIKFMFPDADLFVPMEHFISDGELLSNDIWARKVFEMDVHELETSDLVCAMYLGHYSDTGTAWEIGYAYAKGIKVYLTCPNDGQMSIMPIQSADGIIGRQRSEFDQK